MAREQRHPILTDVGLLMIRLMLGVVFLFHGSQKLFSLFDGPGLAGFAEVLGKMGLPFPQAASVVVGCVEFFGGLLLATGIAPRLAAIALAAVMFGASFVVHRDAFSIQKNGMEYALTLGVVLTALVLSGPGRFSLLPVLRFRRRKSSSRE